MPDVREESIQLQYHIFKVFNQVKKEADSIFKEHGLTGAQVGVLARLRDTDGKPMGMLGAELWCDVSNITGIVDRLEKQGLVERTAKPGDRRINLIRITPKGREALSTVLPEHENALVERMKRLSAEERAELSQLLEKLSA